MRGSIPRAWHTPWTSAVQRAHPSVEDDVRARASALTGEQVLLVEGPLPPVLGDADATALEATLHAQVVGHLDPRERGDQLVDASGSGADTLQHEQRSRRDQD